LILILNYSEIREIPKDLDKIFFILKNYNLDKKFTNETLFKYFHTSRTRVVKHIWRKLNGHMEDENYNSYYLSENYENKLYKIVEKRREKMNAISIEELKSEAFKLKNSITNEATIIMKQIFPKFQEKKIEIPSDTWVLNFISRNECKKLKGMGLEPQRAENASKGNITKWFNEKYLKLKLEEYPPSLVFNMDETMLEASEDTYRIVRKSDTYAPTLKNENLDHISIVVTIAASGHLLPPMIICKLELLPISLINMVSSQILAISGQKSGWMDEIQFLEWTKFFLKHLKDRRASFNLNDKKALLILDDHTSRANPIALQLLKDSNVDVQCYPSHCTHVLQALDIGMFSTFKSCYKKQLIKNRDMEFIFKTIHNNIENTIIVSKRQKLRCKYLVSMISALQQSCTYDNIVNAFNKCGIYPPSLEKALSSIFISPNEKSTLEFNIPADSKGINISGHLITDQVIIDLLKERKEIKAKNLKEKNKRKEERIKKKTIKLQETLNKGHKRLLRKPSKTSKFEIKDIKKIIWNFSNNDKVESIL